MIFLECVLSFAVPIGWGLRELYLLNRRPPPPRDQEPPAAPKPLPPELLAVLPKPRTPSRVLEDA